MVQRKTQRFLFQLLDRLKFTTCFFHSPFFSFSLSLSLALSPVFFIRIPVTNVARKIAVERFTRFAFCTLDSHPHFPLNHIYIEREFRVYTHASQVPRESLDSVQCSQEKRGRKEARKSYVVLYTITVVRYIESGMGA